MFAEMNSILWSGMITLLCQQIATEQPQFLVREPALDLTSEQLWHWSKMCHLKM